MSEAIGERIAIYRKRKGISQAQLAGLVGRSESWLSQVERGIHSVDKLSVLVDIGAVLGVNVETLAGRPWKYAPNGGTELVSLNEIRKALTGYGHLLGGSTAPWPVAQLRSAVVEANRAYQAAEYGRAATMLPDLLASVDAYGDVSREIYLARSEAYAVTSKLLTKVGEAHLAWISADRAVSAAIASESVAAQAQAAHHVVCALLRADRTDEAENLAMRSAERIAGRASADEPELTSVAGSLWLISGIIAARRADRHESTARLDQAANLADVLGHDGNYGWNAFGPTNVAIHRTSAAAELGDPTEVLRMATTIDTEELPEVLRSRRTRIHLDLAWAQAQRRHDLEAIYHLRAIDSIAPEVLRYHVIAREIIRDMLKRERRNLTPALRRIAMKAGLVR